MRRPLPAALVLLAVPLLAAATPAPSHETLLERMSDAERGYYRQSFDYAMEAMKAGETHHWQSSGAQGDLLVLEPFVHGKTVCRKFSESIQLKGESSLITRGAGCKRIGRPGWCRLNQGDMLTCALEPPDTSVEGAVRDVTESLERGNTTARSWWWRWWPF